MATQAALHKFYRARVTGNKNEVLRAACELEVASKSLRKVADGAATRGRKVGDIDWVKEFKLEP